MRLFSGIRCVYITFPDSRACHIAFVAGIIVFCGVLYHEKIAAIKVVILFAVVAVALSAVLPTAIKSGYNSFAVQKSTSSSSGDHSGSGTSEQQLTGKHNAATQLVIRPKRNERGNISNRRIDIWKSAIGDI